MSNWGLLLDDVDKRLAGVGPLPYTISQPVSTCPPQPLDTRLLWFRHFLCLRSRPISPNVDVVCKFVSSNVEINGMMTWWLGDMMTWWHEASQTVWYIYNLHILILGESSCQSRRFLVILRDAQVQNCTWRSQLCLSTVLHVQCTVNIYHLHYITHFHIAVTLRLGKG